MNRQFQMVSSGILNESHSWLPDSCGVSQKNTNCHWSFCHAMKNLIKLLFCREFHPEYGNTGTVQNVIEQKYPGMLHL